MITWTRHLLLRALCSVAHGEQLSSVAHGEQLSSVAHGEQSKAAAKDPVADAFGPVDSGKWVNTVREWLTFVLSV
jgi:hypothetical protein